ncbi:MAG: hypothetical protein WAP03_22065 [Methylorubrum rhodinum]|uniref:phage baseplate assembly protein n=1 Tax=Methylorubrum rhodinum TaxID=29428 RepID=UPI003BB024CF
MPDPRLVCEVRAKSGIYLNWTSVSVEYTYADTRPIRRFSLVCAEPSEARNVRLRPGEQVDVTLGGKKVIVDGFIKTRQVGYDATRHAVSVTGLAKAGHVQEASVDHAQFRGYTLEQIGNAITKKHGVAFRMANAPKGANTPFPNVITDPDQTDWQFLTGLARNRGVMIQAAANGDLIAGIPDGGSGFVLEEGRNIFALNCYTEFPWAEYVVGWSQTQGSDQKFGSSVSEVSAQAGVPGGATGLIMRVVADRPLNAAENQTATDAYTAELLLSTLQCTVTHHGWFKPGTNDLWELGDKVTVKSPMAFPNDSGQLELRVFTVVLSQTPEGQTLTAITLVSEAVFAKRFPDGTAGDPFKQAATSAADQTPV